MISRPLRADPRIANVVRDTPARWSRSKGEGSPLRTAAMTSETAVAWPLSWLMVLRPLRPLVVVVRKLSHRAVQPPPGTSNRSFGSSLLAFAGY